MRPEVVARMIANRIETRLRARSRARKLRNYVLLKVMNDLSNAQKNKNWCFKGTISYAKPN